MKRRLLHFKQKRAGPKSLSPAFWLAKRLEVELASELQLARIASTDDLPGTACVGAGKCFSRLRCGQTDVDIAPLRVVEHVVGLKPQLDPDVLSKVKVFEQGHIEVCNSRSVDAVAAEVAETAGGWSSKDRRVEPLRISSRGLTMTMSSQYLTTDIIWTYVAEAAITQVSAGIEIATVPCSSVEARTSTPKLGHA